jgi:hypothetical protein
MTEGRPIRRPQVHVLGTSNSLMKEGWLNLTAPALKAAGFKVKRNLLGGASSCYWAWQVTLLPALRQRDRVVLDFSINDQMYVATDRLPPAASLGHVAAILVWAAQKGCLDRLLFVLFPQQNMTFDGVESPNMDAMIALFRRFGVDHIDFRPWLRAWAAAAGHGPNEVFPDPLHYAPAYQTRIGMAVLDRLCTPAPRPTPAQMVERRVLPGLPQAGFRELTLMMPDGTPAEMVGTSVVQKMTWHLSHGAAFTAEGAPFCVGTLTRCHDTGGVLSLRDDQGGGVTMNLCRNVTRLFQFDTLHTPLRTTTAYHGIAAADPALPKLRPQQKVLKRPRDVPIITDVVGLLGADHAPADYWAMFNAAVQPASSPWKRLSDRIRAFRHGLRRRRETG